MSGQQVICTNNGVTLGMNEEGAITNFILRFSLENTHADLRSMIGFKLFELMGVLSPDVIESAKVLSETESDGKTLLMLKPFGRELGLMPKYLYSSTSIVWSADKEYVEIKSRQVELPNDISVPAGAEPAEAAASLMRATFSTPHRADVMYEFAMVLDSSMPRYMRKMPGNMMHIVFSRVKEFIEKVGTDTKR